MRTLSYRLFLLAAVVVMAFGATPARAQAFDAMAVISSTLGVSANRVCIGEGTRGDLGCPAYAPAVSSTGALNIAGNLRMANSGEACSAASAGAMRWNGTQFQTCFGSGGWSTLTSAGVSGTVGNQIAFSVHKNGTDQAVTPDGWSQLTWPTEEYDTNNNFASNRFTPTVAGKYIFSANAFCFGSSAACQVSFYKNGVPFKDTLARSTNPMASISAQMDMNGTTDYVELYVYNVAGNTVLGESRYTYWQGALLNARGADGGGGGATSLAGLTDVSLAGPTSGQVLTYNGSAWTNSAGSSGDRMVSSTTNATVNGASGYVSLTTAGNTWGYLGSGASYLPRITTAFASATTISASYVQIPSATTALACSAGVAGTMRYTSGTMQVCNGTSWGNVGIGMPTGTITAFATASCPAGWSEYTPARGRFLRGIDNGAGNDPAGTRAVGDVQTDAFQGHIHSYETPNVYDDYIGGNGTSARVATTKNTGNPVSDGTNGTPRTATETRPKNVAVTYCQYNGYDSATSGSLWASNGSNITYVGGNVGIGTAAPTFKLDVLGSSANGIKYSNGTIGAVLGVGSTAAQIGSLSGHPVEFLVGSVVRATLDTNGYFAANGRLQPAMSDPNAYIRSGNSGQVIVVAGNGSFYHEVPGPTYYQVSTAGGATSDLRVKQDIKPIEGALDKLGQLNGITFTFKKDYLEKDIDSTKRGTQVGLVAQEVEKVFPMAVHTDSEGLKTVQYENMVAPLIEAVKELKAENDALKARIEKLEK